MKTLGDLITLTSTSPSSATTAISSAVSPAGLLQFDYILIDAFLAGATGGTLDVYLQRQITTNVWADWVHFTQLAAGAAAIHYTLVVNGLASTIATVGGGTDASPSLALAAGSYSNVFPLGAVRTVYVAGASTSAGASQTIYLRGHNKAR